MLEDVLTADAEEKRSKQQTAVVNDQSSDTATAAANKSTSKARSRHAKIAHFGPTPSTVLS